MMGSMTGGSLSLKTKYVSIALFLRAPLKIVFLRQTRINFLQKDAKAIFQIVFLADFSISPR